MMSHSISVDWQCQHWQEISSALQYELLRVRCQVFVVEQNCAYQEIDGLDPQSIHLYGTVSKEVAAYMRITPPGVRFEAASLSRILTIESMRSRGLGRRLVAEGISTTQKQFPKNDIQISSQAHLDRFYQSFGFTTISDVYLVDDLPHIDMRLTASQSA